MGRKNWYSIIVGAVIISFGITGYSIHVAQKIKKEEAMQIDDYLPRVLDQPHLGCT